MSRVAITAIPDLSTQFPPGFTDPSQAYIGSIGFAGSHGAWILSVGLDNSGFDGSIGYLGSILPDTGILAGHIDANGFLGSFGWVRPLGFFGSVGVGVNGFTGSVGFTGSQGIGFTGSQGLIGFTGSTGNTGGSGSTGFTGSVGNAGGIGFTGSVGVGFTGSVGNSGGSGFTGSVGFTGSTGNTGGTGFTGSVGFTGSIGNTGGSGSTGFTGSAGPSSLSASQTAIAIGNTYHGGLAQVSGSSTGFDLFTPDSNTIERITIFGKNVNDGSAPTTAFVDEGYVQKGPPVTYVTLNSTTVAGSPGARTYTDNAGKLHVSTAGGPVSWNVDIVILRNHG